MSKVLALTQDGKITYCCSSPDKRGIGRCNHIAHQTDEELPETFIARASSDSSRIVRINKTRNSFFLGYVRNNLIDGAQQKFIEDDYYYKLDSQHSFLGAQRNALSEEMSCLIANQIEDETDGFQYVDYSCGQVVFDDDVQICSKSKNFKPENKDFKNLLTIFGDDKCDDFRREEFDEENYEEVYVDHNPELQKFVEACQEKFGFDPEYTKEYVLRMISFDLLILNGDRSFNNIGVLYNKDTQTYEFSPYFDHGDAVLSYSEYDDLDYENEADERVRICLFGVSTNESYQDLVTSNGGPFLKMDLSQAIADINAYKNQYYDEKIIERNKKLLIHRLRKYNGILFQDTSKGD